MTNNASDTKPDIRALRDAFAAFASGVTVVTYEHEDRPLGLTVNSFTSLSLDPTLVLFNIRRGSKAAHIFSNKPFTVNVLSENQLPTAMQFAGGSDQDYVADWNTSGIAPRLNNPHAYFTATPWATYDGGDHIIVIGEVTDFDVDPHAKPLVFHQSRFKEIH
ncbi:MAG: flavin reductase family protein [Actinomyces sp.]|uniref:flavin reductase family protein n=1 Tax=Actinomyces sp. TaxID=29317 RepID=UPI0028054062|nr:flavin reductase family protein [Actinomyces sp.]MDK8352140.1 flavin reductase family protein [Gleimia europaea]MDK8533544.1 flavin reductase family protein [Gleimia europaea]MDU4830977.1 flavin reductase family protein [Actinomyces sp.]MDU5231710.1 flavin reductase family protein [Actinomyces sp.]MDU6757308.1 flavin reductase family protein [Actinomyces sp.]